MAADVNRTAPASAQARGGVAALLVAAGAALILLALFWGRPVNQDTAWYLVATRQWLEGARLYVDLVEINPPLNFYLTVPAILLADLTGMGDPNAQFVLLAALLALSLSWAGNVLAQAPDLDATRRSVFLGGVALALLAMFLNAMAQREQLMLILILPWLLAQLALPCPDRGGWGLARAAVAALGICLKHYFLAYPVAVTLWQMLRQRSLRPIVAPGNLVMLAVGAGYVGFVWLRHPEYFREVVPAAFLVYGDYGYSAQYVLLYFRPLTVALGVILLGIAGLRRPAVPGSGFWAAVIAAAGSSYLVQWTGYEYQALPVQALIVMAAAWVMVRAGADRVMAVLGGLCILALLATVAAHGPLPNATTVRLTAALREAGPVERLATLSSDMAPGPAVALGAGAEWSIRYPLLWQVPGAVNGLARTDCAAESEICARLRRIEAENRRNIVSDLVTRPPDVLIVDRTAHYILVPGFTWESYLLADPRYPALRAGYRELTRAGDFTLLIRD